MTATPSAPETMRATVLVADATPDFAAGTAPTTAPVAGAMIQPMASAARKNQTGRGTGAGCGSQRGVSASMSAKPVRPTAITREAPIRSTALLDEPAPIIRP